MNKSKSNNIWDLLTHLSSWPKRKNSKGEDIVDKKEMKRVEERRYDSIRGQRSDYRCSKCKSVLEVVEFVYGNITVVKVNPCGQCADQLACKSYSEGYDKGYEFGKDDV